MAAKKKRLPKDFEELLAKGDLEALQKVFDSCLVDARGGYAKQTALAFDECPAELTRWLVARGADLGATDTWGNTPLHSQAGSRRGCVDVLIELGADVRSATASIGTPLHSAADRKRVANATALLAKGAEVDARNKEGLTPLELALRGCSNIELAEMVALGRVFLSAGALRTPIMGTYVTEIGKRFEFHRAGFASDHVAAASEALEALYALFEVAPVPRRVLHDGTSTITVKSTSWQKQHAELWDMLVPSSGAAATVQGEVIRIAGRLGRELDGNGGINWDQGFVAMARAFLAHVESQKPLAEAPLADVRHIVDGLARKGAGDTRRLAELAVVWVLQNPLPVPLGKPAYTR